MKTIAPRGMALQGMAILMALGLAACSDRPDQKRQVMVAPATADSVGVVVEGASLQEVNALLEDYPESKVRIVSEAHQIYELYDIKASVVSDRLPEALVETNVFRQTQATTSEVDNVLMSMAEEENPMIIDGVDYSTLAECQMDLMGPTLKVNFTKKPKTWRNFTIDLGDEVSLTLKDSKANALAPGPLKKAFIITPAMGSALEPQLIPGEQMTLKPDALGQFKVDVVVQDTNNNCDFSAVPVLVTTNLKMKKLELPKEKVRELVPLESFWHLAPLNTKEAWKKSTGEGVKIAILDTGVNYNHPLLNLNIALNEKEIADNGLDDDGNGFIDDAYGYDFSNSDPYAFDDNRHGSHVAGLAASTLFGQAKDAKIIPVKVMNAGGGADDATIAAGIRYAVDQGAAIINVSLGGGQKPHAVMNTAILYAKRNNALVIAASGNGHPLTGLGMDVGVSPFYPAVLDYENMLTVASTTEGKELAPYSNFGAPAIDVAAIGGNMPEKGMLSTIHQLPKGHSLANFSGTSMATPIVAGIAALVKSMNPDLTAVELKDIVMNSGQLDEDLEGLVATKRHANALGAVNAVSSLNPL